MASGGSVESISFAGREFAVAADSDANIRMGGFSNENRPNGNETTRKILTRVDWQVSGLNVVIDPENGDQEFLQERSDAKDFEVFSITLVNGVTYQGVGSPTGDIEMSTMAATASVTFGGPGKLTKQ